MKSLTKCAIILGGGKGSRANLGYNKVLYSFDDTTILQKSVQAFADFNQIIVVYNKDDYHTFLDMFGSSVTLVCGGDTRSQSVRNALCQVNCDIVLIHDGARPFVSKNIINDCVNSVINFGSGIAGYPSTNAIKYDNGNALVSIDRNKTYIIQTPQGFFTKDIITAYNKVSGTYADDSEVFDKAGFKSKISLGSPINKKLTNPFDFTCPNDYKIGSGFDVHQLVENRKLILGGVTIPYEKGLLGHSDADVLTHAIMDALLSASNLPDIGVLFPDTSDEFLDANSIELLKKVCSLLTGKIVNISAVIIAQKPKLKDYILPIRTSLAQALNISLDKINVSATTTEHLGIVGEGRAIASNATVLLDIK